MATLYECDRCARRSKQRDEIFDVIVPTIESYSREVTMQHKDLCLFCLQQLAEIVKALPAVSEKK